jgi:hypothetical protein
MLVDLFMVLVLIVRRMNEQTKAISKSICDQNIRNLDAKVLRAD